MDAEAFPPSSKIFFRFKPNNTKKDRVHHPATLDVGRNLRDDE